MILKFKVTSSSWWTEKGQITYASIPGSKSDVGIVQEKKPWAEKKVSFIK